MPMSHTDIPSARSTQKSIKLEYGLDIKPETHIIAIMTTEKVKEFIKNKCLEAVGAKTNEDDILVLTPDESDAYSQAKERWGGFYKSCEAWNWNYGYAEVAKDIIDNYNEWDREDLFEFVGFYFGDPNYRNEIENIIEVFE